ncbi:FAD-binding oxidoreductase [Mesorhizobium sp. B2-1-3A]|uniref:FAD-binding oxidoreductase n=1 Tax=Mesorhizobium sp. B2-1-3A TaxID=2589971 RepID=UPI00112CD58C|nr:FAD-binding oxidoreductase [Mesorhizobium sp. B2-1-3A]TPM94846.1 FAD-binding oxidoreductase [Mesorhizobium sp. B2-1-3A]
MARLAELRSIVGQHHVVDGEELRSRPQDFWNNVPTTALGLVKPGSVEEVSAVLSFCDRRVQPVIVEGGRTNLVHATLATPDMVLMSLERLNRLQPPNTDGMTVEAEAGVVLENLQLAAQKSGLRFGLDLGARGSATVGGVLSTNAGGFQALRYGVARDQVLGLECVLANGTVLSHLVPYTKDNSGYDLKHLFIGAEGTLGVITKAVLRLHPAPQTVNTALLAFDSFGAVVGALRTMRQALRGTLSSFEIMWREFYDFNVAAVCPAAPPLPIGFPYYVLCEAEGFAPDSDATEFEATMAGLLESGAASDIVVAQSSRQRADIWRIREEFQPEIDLFKVMLDFDVSLPISTMEAFVDETATLLAKEVPENLGLHVIGHLGDGNLHVTTGLANPERKAEVQKLIYGLIRRYRGSISAEHGIGVAKKPFLDHSRSADEIATMRMIKSALDPHGILNPGKII